MDLKQTNHGNRSRLCWRYLLFGKGFDKDWKVKLIYMNLEERTTFVRGIVSFVLCLLTIGNLIGSDNTALSQNVSKIVLPSTSNATGTNSNINPITNLKISHEIQIAFNNYSALSKSSKIVPDNTYIEPFISNSTIFQGNFLLMGQRNNPIENHTVLRPTFSN